MIFVVVSILLLVWEFMCLVTFNHWWFNYSLSCSQANNLLYGFVVLSVFWRLLSGWLFPIGAIISANLDNDCYLVGSFILIVYTLLKSVRVSECMEYWQQHQRQINYLRIVCHWFAPIAPSQLILWSITLGGRLLILFLVTLWCWLVWPLFAS